MRGEGKSEKQVVIIGGGPAGLTAAYELSKVGVESTIIEQCETIGGLSRTVNYKDYYFDIGGHRFFTKVELVENMWKEVLGADFLFRNRLSRIYYNKKFFYYPLRPVNALLSLGVWNSILIVSSYLYSQLFPSKEEDTLEQWVSNRFGARLFNIFFKTYTEKVWGISCNEIRAEWAAQRIKGLSLITALRNALIGTQANNGKRKNVIKTLIDQFNYPKLGPGMMWQAVAEILRKNGSQIRLGTKTERILWSGGRVEGLELRRNGQTEWVYGTDFISTMPIKEAMQKFKPGVPKEVLDAGNNLKYRDFLTVALIINKSDVFPDNWIYVHDPDVKVGRIQNYKNWSPHMVSDQKHTCLGLEYFCFEGDDFWSRPDDELIELAKRELETLEFANKNDVEDGTVVRMPKAYPIYDATYQKSLNVVRQFLEGIENLQLVGRNGMHRYNNQDHSMLTAMLAAENILGASHDLWKVNAEEEYSEEVRKGNLDKFVEGVFPRMDKLGFATAVGSVFGLIVFSATLFMVIRGFRTPEMLLLGQYFFGYSVTVQGAFIGMVHSFFWGFFFGWLFAYLRNLSLAFYIYRIRKGLELIRFQDFLDHF